MSSSSIKVFHFVGQLEGLISKFARDVFAQRACMNVEERKRIFGVEIWGVRGLIK